MVDIKNFTINELSELLNRYDLPNYCSKQIFGWIYQKRIEDFNLMTNIPKDVRLLLKDKFYCSNLKIEKEICSEDGTKKFLFKLSDNNYIETVLIPEGKRLTLCVSSQVGCKYKCSFCMSGKDGFKRNLTVSEIVNQFLQISDKIAPEKITNIVFMGVGEPLDNLENTVKAIENLRDSQGINFSSKRITISTCGLIPEIKNLISLKLGVKLSISLHAASDDLRNRLMPVNKKYPLKDLMVVLREFSRREKSTVTFEYVLIDGVNISEQDAKKLVKLLHGIRAKLNLIPYNISSFKWKAPDKEEISKFTEMLKRKGIFYTLRKSKGQDIEAACGQLRARCSKENN
jgi:23S rRNA (adenine2503-C2)-methyltransferase